MRIALFSNGFPEKPDGNYAPAVIDTLLQLSQRHEIWVFALGGMRPVEKKYYRFERLHVLATGPMTLGNFVWKTAELLRYGLQLHRKQPFHLAHGIWHVGSLAATIFGKLAGCPVLLSMLGGEIVNLPELAYGAISKKHWRLVLRWCLAQADAITTGSRYYFEKISAFAPAAKEKIVLTPLGIVPDDIPLRDDGRNDKLRLLNVAALQPVKNISHVLQMVSQFRSSEWHLTIAGTGPLESELGREIERLGLQDRVHCARWQAEKHFKQQLPKYDLLFSLSSHEAQGMAMIEAAAAGLPILSTRVGVAEELAHLGSAIVFVDSPATAFANFQQCLQNLPSLQQQALTTAPRVRAEYNLVRTVRRFEELYQQLGIERTMRWYQTPLPLGMKLRRKIRPLLFRLVMPALNHQIKKNKDTAVDGLKLRTDKEVFHPKYFFSSKLLGRYLASRVSSNQKVLDMGTGSGVIGIMAAKRNAQVVAVDVNPAAVELANENASLHNLNGRWRCMESGLFARLDSKEKFDWVVFNPPYFPGLVQRPEDAAWYAGDDYETIDRFLAQAENFLKANGKIILILTSDMPLTMLHEKFQNHGYRVVAHQAEPHLFEIFHLVELQPVDGE
jgi:release factor glutamine methyltransferase